MKKILQMTKQTLIVLYMIIGVKSADACTLRGKIIVDASTCVSQNVATLRLTNHTTTAGTTYAWQLSTDNGVSWNTMITNSGKDTQTINPGILGRMYRCLSTCPTGTVVSDTAFIWFMDRFISVDRVICSSVLGGNDSIVLKAKPLTTATDTAFAKNFKWQYSSTKGAIWNTLLNNSTDSIRVQFTPNNISYRAFLSLCPLTGPESGYPSTNPQFISQVDIGLGGIDMQITDKDCVNDSARLSLTNLTSSLRGFLKYRWFDSTTVSGAFNFMGKTDSFLTVKVDNENRFYKASVKLCNAPYPSKDSAYTKIYALWVKLGNFTTAYDCLNTLNETVFVDYTNRDLARKSVYLYWTRSNKDSLHHTSFNVPIDSVLYSFTLSNYTNLFFKVYSKFCPSSSKILDSSMNLNVKLIVDTGQLKATIYGCTNDSVYIKHIKSSGDSSNFLLYKKWMIKANGSSLWEDYTQNPMTDTTITFRMKNGWNEYRRTVSICPDKYAKKFNSTIVKTFLPFQVVDTIACSGPMTVRLFEDTVKIIDYTGTTIRNNSTFAYQWIKSANKITSTIVPGATGSTLSITQADKRNFFKRLTRLCSTNGFSDTSNWSNLVFINPNSLNGRAEVFDEVCLNDSVRICVVNFTPKTGDTATYLWQVSNDDITWTSMLTNLSNDSCIKVLAESNYKYYRRLTYWCPSGAIDSSISTPLIYIQNIPWCESFTNQLLSGKDVYFNCWRGNSPVCNTYNPVYAGSQIWSRTDAGKTTKGMSNWGPVPSDPRTPPGRRADGKLITPAFYLKRGKIYRFSFWHKETTANICWDSLYVSWGNKPTPCDITNRFGELLTKFSFDQYNKFWSDFVPQDDGVYYFAINFRDKDQTTGEITFDDVCLKEIFPCNGVGVSPVKGQTFAPSKIIDRVEEPSASQTYDKDKVTHQYCIGDTIMLTYNESNYASNFDYYGMTYQFWKKREDQDWKINDTFFKPVQSDTLCHITNRSNYHVMNVLVTDTHTWYKIVATCSYNGRTFHADSLLVNGTHSVPYCEDWEGPGRMQNQPPATNMAPPLQGNSGEIVGKVPSFSQCPTCWAAYPQNSTTNPQPTNLSLFTTTLPFQNIIGGVPQVPQLEPDQGWNGSNVVINEDNGAPALTRKILVFPATRLYKGRGYRISFRWADNRRSIQSPWGNVNQDLDSLYLVAAKGNLAGSRIDSFPRTKMIPGSLLRDISTNEKESGNFKYRTYWQDFSPNDTATYYLAIAVVPGPGNGNPYRFYMDYFCIDTLPMDDCQAQPKFQNPLRVRISPDGKVWNPGDTIISPIGSQWCVGNKVNIELDYGFGPNNNWMYGWKMYWQRNTNRFSPNWVTFDSSNAINYILTYKYKDFRLILANSCKTKFDTIGPFKVLPPGGDVPWFEGFESSLVIPPCWDVYSTCRAMVKGPDPNEFFQSAKCSNNYVDMDFASPSTTSCLLRPSVTVVPPGFGVIGGVTHRFSFWYKDNGISYPIDSIKAAWSYSRPTDVATNVLVNKVNNDIVRNSRTNKWRYYTTEFTPAVDTTYHIKVTTFSTNTAKRVYRTMFDNFHFKFKQVTDALVIAVDSPDCQCDLPYNTNLKVTVMNIGSNALLNIPIKVQVNGGTPVSYTVPGPIGTNGTKTVYVPGVDLAGGKVGSMTHHVNVWTEVPGEQDPFDDTFCTDIVYNERYPKPTDTIDSVCICSNLRYNENSPNGQTKWYKNMTDFTPFSIGDALNIDSLCRDTTLYRATWNGGVAYTTPPNFSYGAPTYSTAANGLTFDNISKDTILIDSVMVYANTISTVPFNISVTQFYGAQQIPIATTIPLIISKLGKQWLPIKIKIPPGTDYQIRYPGGTAALAQLPGFIFIGSGVPSFSFNIVGDINYPAAANGYPYFFNMRLIRMGCESERVPIHFVTVPSPKFKIKDTNRVCSQPVYQVCGPDAPIGSTYKYQWNITPTDTLKCIGATNTNVYKLSVTNEFGCTETDSLTLIVDPSPQFSLGPDTSFCRYSPHTISTGLDSLYNVVTWSDNQAGVSIKVLNPATYIATAYNTANFCTAKDTVVVNRRELPVFSLGNDRVYCGSTADISSLAPNLPTTGMTYSWGGSPSAPIINTQGINKVWVNGTDAFGCKNSDTIIANLVANPVFDLGPDQNVCGASTTLNGPVGKYYYRWSTTSTSRTLLVSTPGTYYLTITDTVNGCKGIDSVKVTFKTVPVFDLGSDVVKCALTHVISAMTGSGLNYNWKKPSQSAYFPGVSTFLADESGVYYCRIDNNCYTYTDSVKVTLKTPPLNAIDLLKDTFGCGQVTVRATSTNNYSKIQWSTNAIDTSNLKQFTTSGSYSVSLWNECGNATKSVIIRIDSPPTANFSVTYPDCMTAAFTNLSRNGVTYLWQFGDNSTSALENPIRTYTAEGDYLVTLKTYNSCGFAAKTLPIAKRFKNCNGSSGISVTTLSESQLYVYPNPTKDVTNIIGVGLPNGVYTISISNILGQKVHQSESRVTDNRIDMYLNVSKFASGEYVVHISNDSEDIVRKLEILK